MANTFRGEFRTIAELVELCQGMKLEDYRYFNFVGSDYPDINETQKTLQRRLPQEAGVYFECIYIKPPELAVRLTRNPGATKRRFI